MDVEAVTAALNDTYKMNSKRVVQLFQEADARTSLESIELEGFIDYTKSRAMKDEGLEPLVEKLISTLQNADLDEYRQYIDSFDSSNEAYISVLEPKYPPELRDIEKPPLGLYVHGDIETHRDGVALVGTRSATDHRLEFAHEIGKKIVEHGRTVISGLATGVDEAGHRSAISHGGKTIGVLPGHINKIYPEENEQIANNIPGNGALVSEVSDNVPLNRHRFVERNRITSGLSEAVIIAASKNSGGTVRQAEFADTQDIPILLYDPEKDDGQSPKAIKEMGAHTFSDLEDLDELLSDISSLREPNGGNLKIDEYE